MPFQDQESSHSYHPHFSNLLDSYEPIKLLSHALRDPQGFLEGKYGIRHAGLYPDFDLRETAEAYYLEGEFPGIKGREAIKLQWLDGQTLRVEGKIEKIDIVKEWRKPPQHVADISSSGGIGKEGREEIEVTHKNKSDNDGGEDPDGTRNWLHERRIGTFSRTFTFPNAVHQDDIHAKLSQGLLRIVVPKIHKSKLRRKEINIEDAD